MKLASMNDLYIALLQDTFNAEKQLIKALPKMAKNASNSELADGFTTHLEETREHAARLERIIKDLGKRAGGEQCEAMEGLIEEGQEVIDAEEAEDAVRDAALIVAAQKVEHYEIAAYGSLCTFARLLGRTEDERILQQTLEEEKATDEKLNALAESSINMEAAQADGEEGEDEDSPKVQVRSRRSGSTSGGRSRSR